MNPAETDLSRPGFAESTHQPAFVTTHWSVVLKAGADDTTQSRDALAALCQAYWYPIYAHVRRRGHSAQDAQDLTQGFFAQLLERHALAIAAPERGRFRSFLLTALNNFVATEWEKRRAKKRGGDCTFISLDWAAAQERYDLEPFDDRTPDKAFDKEWALQLLEGVLETLSLEYDQDGKTELFAALKQTLTGTRESQAYAELAARLGLSEGAVKVAVHRLRKRYRELIRQEIARTVESPADVDSEMRHLLDALAGR